MEEADKLVDRVFEILRYFQPNLWWIENPRGGFLKSLQPMQNVAFIDVDYCQFSDFGYQKPTRIWGPQKITSLPNVHRQCRNNGIPSQQPRLDATHWDHSGHKRGRCYKAVLWKPQWNISQDHW